MSLGMRKAISGSIPLFCEHDAGAGVTIHVSGDVEYSVDDYWPGDWHHPPEGGEVEYVVKPELVELHAGDEVVLRLHITEPDQGTWAEFAVNELGDETIREDCRDDAEQRLRFREASR